jgi:signal transduction histidine kinase
LPFSPDPPFRARAAHLAADSAPFVFDPATAKIASPNAKASRLFASLDGAEPFTLDAAMPAVQALRELAQSETARFEARLLTWWTNAGRMTCPCSIVRVRNGQGETVFDVMMTLAAPRTRPRAQHIASPLPRDDSETLREIAKRIREGQTRVVANFAASAANEAGDVRDAFAPFHLFDQESGSGEAGGVPHDDAGPPQDDSVTAADSHAGSISSAPIAHALEDSPDADTEDNETGLDFAKPEPDRDRDRLSDAHSPQDDENNAVRAHQIDLAKLAHELKSPLSAIAAAAEVMRDERFGALGDQRYTGYVAGIHDTAHHALAVVDRMLKGAPDFADPRRMAFASIDLNRLVGSCVASMQPLATQAGIALTTNLAREAPQVVADQTSLRQIILNLITNALKFTPRGGGIVVETNAARGAPVSLSISDTGSGMTPAQISDSLRPVSGVLPTPRTGGGFGMGLPMVHAMVEANGARLKIESEPGNGTTVRIVFPKGRLIAI